MSMAVIFFFSFFIRPRLHTTPPPSTTTRLRIDEKGPKQNQYSAPTMTAILTSITIPSATHVASDLSPSTNTYLQYALIRIALVQQPRGLDLRPPAPRAAEIAHVRRLLDHLVLDRQRRDPYEQRDRVPRQEADGVAGVRGQERPERRLLVADLAPPLDRLEELGYLRLPVEGPRVAVTRDGAQELSAQCLADGDLLLVFVVVAAAAAAARCRGGLLSVGGGRGRILLRRQRQESAELGVGHASIVVVVVVVVVRRMR